MLSYKGEPLVPNTAESGSEQFLPNSFEHCDHINLNIYIIHYMRSTMQSQLLAHYGMKDRTHCSIINF